MLRDWIGHLAPLIGLCDHPLRLAEIVLLALFCIGVGCCCGGLITAFILSPWIRNRVTKIVSHLLDPEGRVRAASEGPSGQSRLQRYRA